jgi:hypothetical protein
MFQVSSGLERDSKGAFKELSLSLRIDLPAPNARDAQRES